LWPIESQFEDTQNTQGNLAESYPIPRQSFIEVAC